MIKRISILFLRGLLRNKRVFLIFFLCLAIILKIFLHFPVNNSLGEEVFDNIFLWWTPFTLREGKTVDCNGIKCYFTSNKSYITNPALKGVLFYGSQTNVSKLPVPKSRPWALLHEESPRNNPLLTQPAILTLFDFSSTFSRHSHMPLTLQYLPSVAALKDNSFFIKVTEKDQIMRERGIFPIVYLQSDCCTPNNRDSYVAELMKYIPIDSYGSCLHNKDLPDYLTDSMATMMSHELFKFLSVYKFAISFENAACNDYITEKLWRPLMIGVVPIYYGSPTIKDWLPNEKSAILVSDFRSPKDLAEYIKTVNSSSELYNEYLTHKLEMKIENHLLIDSVKEDNDYIQTGSFISEFECFFCEKIHRGELSSVSKEHYDCENPKSMLSLETNSSNWWHSEWKLDKCRAEEVRRYLDSGQNPPKIVHC